MKKITLDENVAEIHNSVVFDSPTSAYIQIVEALREFYSHGASLVSAEVFAPRSFEPVIAPLLDSNFPVNWILPLKEVSDNILIWFSINGNNKIMAMNTPNIFGTKAMVISCICVKA